MRIESAVVPGREPRYFRVGGKPHFAIRVYLVEDRPSELAQVRQAVYELHESFKDRFRVSRESPSFPIEILTYGSFDIKAQLLLADGTYTEAKGRVRVPVTPKVFGQPPSPIVQTF